MSKKARFRTLDAYLIREFCISFSIAFVFFFFIFFVNQLLLIARNILISAVSLTDVARIIIYSVPIILSFTFPFATLSGSAMTLGTLSSSREIIALRSSGISFRRILKPLFIIGLIFSAFSFFINDIFLPLGTIEYRKLYRELLYKTPELEIQPYSPVFIEDKMIVVRRAGEQHIHEAIIIDTSAPLESRSIITAQSGRFAHNQWEGTSFQFSSVEGIKGRGNESFELYQAQEMEMFFPMERATFSMISISPAEMSFLDVFHEISERRSDIEKKKAADQVRKDEIQDILSADNGVSASRERELRREYESLEGREYVSRTLRFYEIELFRKLALPLGCFFLLFISIPIAAMPLQYGKIIGFGIGVLLSTVYWILLFIGQSMGVRTGIPPFLLMFGPNIVYAGIGLLAFHAIRKR